MNYKLTQARAQVHDLSMKALEIANGRMDAGRMKSALDALEPQLAAAVAEVKSLEHVEGQTRSFDYDAMAASGEAGDMPALTTKAAIGQAPSVRPSADQARELHDAILSHKSAKIEIGLKAGPSSLLPSQLMPGIVAAQHEPTRIAQLLPSGSMTAPVIEYLRHVSTTGTAGTVAPGGLKPSVTLNVDKVEARARKIAVTTTVNDEDLADFAGFLSYIDQELSRLVIDEENAQILLGDGTGENLTGLLNTTGVLTRAKAAAPETGIDTLELAAQDLRTGPAFVDPTLYAMSPTTWTALRLLKDSQGRYLLGNPAELDAAKLWGRPVVTSTAFGAGVVAAMNGPLAGTVHYRSGLTIQSDYGASGFEHNTTTLRAELRVALEVPRPAAIVKVTGL